MKSLHPSIIIWRVSLTDRESGVNYQDFYFLSYHRAVKYIAKNLDKIENTDINSGVAFTALLIWIDVAISNKKNK